MDSEEDAQPDVPSIEPAAAMQGKRVEVLSTDLLALIFLAGLDVADPVQFPVVVSHVCREWRSVALDIGGLWARIVFEVKRNAEGTPEQLFEKPVEWLGRSKGALVDIVLRNVAEDDTSMMEERIGWILSTILPLADRWRSMEATGVADSQLQAFFSRVRDTEVPNLASLTVDPSWSSAQWNFHPFQKGMPKLREFSLRATNIKVDRPFLHSIKEAQVIELGDWALGGDYVGVAENVCYLLEHAASAEVLTVNGSSFDPLQWTKPTIEKPRIVAPKLTGLYIHTPSVLAAVISRVEFPALIEYPGEIKPDFLPIIRDYHPFPNIQVLAIRGFGATWDQPLSSLPGMLSGLLSLRTLVIEGISPVSHDGGEWIKQFGTTCPNLQNLSIDWALVPSEDALSEMVEQRMGAGEPVKRLRELTIAKKANTYDGDSEATKKWLKELRAKIDVVRIKEVFAPMSDWEMPRILTLAEILASVQ